MAALLPTDEYRLAIAGSGPLLQALQSECAARRLTNVSFLGHFADRDLLADCFANADVFVHPNPREPFGITPLEAMASGIALVAPNTGGVTSYANASNAWLTDPTPDAFAAAVAATSTRSEARLTNARQTALEYRWERVTERYLQLFRELHAATQGRESVAAIQARSYSTPGDVFGRELIGL